MCSRDRSSVVVVRELLGEVDCWANCSDFCLVFASVWTCVMVWTAPQVCFPHTCGSAVLVGECRDYLPIAFGSWRDYLQNARYQAVAKVVEGGGHLACYMDLLWGHFGPLLVLCSYSSTLGRHFGNSQHTRTGHLIESTRTAAVCLSPQGKSMIRKDDMQEIVQY